MVRRDEMEELIDGLPVLDRLLWEAPQKHQQQDLIRRFGPNVNLGNIPPGEILALEALRLGLRGDTLRTVLSGDTPKFNSVGRNEV
jgi:phosphosulfolactate synthase